MGNRTLSVPQVSVNNDPISIVPNSFKFNPGKGEINVRSASSGGGGASSVHSENAETKIGKMSFDLYVTPENIALIRGWKENIGANFLSATQSGFTPQALSNASMTNEPEFEATADGKVTCEFSGDPLSNNA